MKVASGLCDLFTARSSRSSHESYDPDLSLHRPPAIAPLRSDFNLLIEHAPQLHHFFSQNIENHIRDHRSAHPIRLTYW